MNKLLKNFKVNTSPKLSDSIEILFDFVVVALVSLIFNGFIINNHNSGFDQKFLMVANAMLLSTHWYAYNFFRQRYEKKSVFFRIWSLVNVLSLAIMAIGIDLLVFRENSNPNGFTDLGVKAAGFLEHKRLAYEYLRWVAPTILVSGFLISRLSMAVQFTLAAVANRSHKVIFKLSINKAISRYMNVAIAIAHLALILITKDVAIWTYIFFPIYLMVELAGNLMSVTDKNLAKAPNVSLNYAKDRYSKLNLLYITSFFVSGSIQFAFYFKDQPDLYMIPRLIMVYLIGFMIWWVYMDRMHRFAIKQNAFNLRLIAVTNIILVGALALFGGLLINANKDAHIDFIAPTACFCLAIILGIFIVNTKSFKNGTGDFSMNRDVKFKYIKQLMPAIAIFIILGVVTSIFLLNIYVTTGTILGVLLCLNIMSRITIRKCIKIPAGIEG